MANRSSNFRRNLWTIDLLDLTGGEDVLEIGCGPGIGLKTVCDKLVSGKVTGIDHSSIMLEQSGKRLEAEIGSELCQLKLGGLELLRDNQAAFDRIYSVNVVQFFAKRDEAFGLIIDALKAGGVCATTYQPRNQNPTRNDAFDMAEEVSSAMDNAGFYEVETFELVLKPVPAVCVTGRRG